MRGRGTGPIWIAVPTLLLLLWLVVYPNLFILGDSLRGVEGWSLEWYRAFLGSRARMEALAGSVWISLASVLASALVGVPLAFLFHARDFPGRKVLAALAGVPVLLPPLVGVIAFLFLLGESGILTRGVQWLLGLESPPWRLVGPWAILTVHAYTMYVYFYLLVTSGLARLDGAAAEAAASLGAGRLRILFRVTLPMLAPSLLAAAVLVFMTSMASFSAPYIFGGGYQVLATRIFTSRVNGEPEMAMVETVVLASVSLLFLALLRWVERGREYAAVGKGTPRARIPVQGGLARWGAAAAGWVGVTVLLLPHLTLLLVSFVPEGGWTTSTLPERYTLENYRALFSDRQLWLPVSNSLRYASLATLANVAVCFLAAWLVVRSRIRWKGLLSSLLILPYALPGTVVAIALATTFAANQPWAGRFVLVGTGAILVVAYFVRNLPLVAQPTIAAFRQFDPALEEAAHSLGAGWGRTLRRIAFPLVLPGIAAGASLAFVTALGEFVASILLYTNRTRPISMEILAQLRAFDFGAASALGVLLALLMGVVFLAGGRFVRGENGVRG